ncbi:unnamed protein product, partial [Vitis vinifera]
MGSGEKEEGNFQECISIVIIYLSPLSLCQGCFLIPAFCHYAFSGLSPLLSEPLSTSISLSPISTLTLKLLLTKFKGDSMHPYREDKCSLYRKATGCRVSPVTPLTTAGGATPTGKTTSCASPTAALAPWCGPCRMIHPIINELAKQCIGKLKCYKVNTDESPSIATRYGIRSIPTVIIFKSREKKEAVIGAIPKSTLTTSIGKFL